LHDLDFDRDPPRLGAMAQILTGANPDLRDFAARGGKLLLYHGAADPVVIPEPTVDYHDRATRVLGGAAAALESWVEPGEAPESLQGRRPATDALPELRRTLPAWR
jgi:feruloyl esterase